LLFTDYIEGFVPNKSQSFIEIQPIESFVFENISFKPNNRYFELLLKAYYKEEFQLINQLFVKELGDSKVFNYPEHLLFISNDLFSASHFIALLNFLEDQIYLFECADFDYNLKVLIERFYNEHNYQYQAQMILDVHEIIVKLKRTVISVNLADVKRLKRRERKGNLKQNIEDFLVEKGEAQKTADILNELKENDIEIEGPTLLHQLNIWNQVFARFGNGMWGLRNWIKGDAPKGSIREIVEGLLQSKDEPIHVSEILNYFETFRPISETSLLSNIRVSENIHFHF